MSSSRRPARSIEEHLSLGLPVLFSELLVFKWTPNKGFPTVTDEFRSTFEHMQEVENLGNELRVFFTSYDGALAALETSEVRRNIFRFLDQYGTIEDLLKNEVLRTANAGRGLVPEYLEERIRNQQKWFKGDDNFSLEFAQEFLRRKFSVARSSFRAPQATSLLPPVPPPRRHRVGSIAQQQNSRPPAGTMFDPSQPSTSQAVLSYTASGRPRRNSAPLAVVSPPKPRRQIPVEQLPSPPPTPPTLRNQREPQNQQQPEQSDQIRDSSPLNLQATHHSSSDPTTSPNRVSNSLKAPLEPNGDSPSSAGVVDSTATTTVLQNDTNERNASQSNSTSAEAENINNLSEHCQQATSTDHLPAESHQDGTDESIVTSAVSQPASGEQLNGPVTENFDNIVQERVNDPERVNENGNNTSSDFQLVVNDHDDIVNNNNNAKDISNDNKMVSTMRKSDVSDDPVHKLTRVEGLRIEDERPLQETAM